MKIPLNSPQKDPVFSEPIKNDNTNFLASGKTEGQEKDTKQYHSWNIKTGGTDGGLS
jgi:hypothetical protein